MWVAGETERRDFKESLLRVAICSISPLTPALFTITITKMIFIERTALSFRTFLFDCFECLHKIYF